MTGGERSGKSFHGALQLVCRLELGSLFWIVAEEYETCEPEFDYVLDFLLKMDNVADLSRPKVGPRKITTKSGILIETRTASDYRRIAEKAPDAILGCEVGRWAWQTFQRVSDRLAEKRGWAWLGGTLESSFGWHAEKLAQWGGPNREFAASFAVPSHTNYYVFPGGEQDPEILRMKASQSEDYFSERHLGIPVPPTGRVYREFQSITHVSEVAKFDPSLPGEVWIDPGSAGAYVVLAVQLHKNRVFIVDEVYVQRLTNKQVIGICTQRPWWKNVTAGVIDVAGRGKMAERSPVEAWWEEVHLRLESEYVHIKDGIDRVKSFLHTNPETGLPGVLVSPACLGLIAEMGAGKHPIPGMGVYHFKVDAFGNPTSEKPEDENNHACSALAYGLVRRYGRVSRGLPAEPGNYIAQADGRRGKPLNWKNLRKTALGIDPELWTPGEDANT